MLDVYCINLARRSDRWANMHSQAEQGGFVLRRVEAVDARDPQTAHKLNAVRIAGPTGILGTAAKACAQSHAKAWEMFLQTDRTHGVFLEDDVRMASDFAHIVSALIAANPPVDVIKLEGGEGSVRKLLLGSILFEAGGRRLRTCHQIAPNAGGYMLTREGAKLALARFAGRTLSIDHFLFYPIAHKGSLRLPFAAMEPPLLAQIDEEGSDIAPMRHEDPDWWRRLRRVPYELAPSPYVLWSMIRGARFYPTPFTEKPQ